MMPRNKHIYGKNVFKYPKFLHNKPVLRRPSGWPGLNTPHAHTMVKTLKLAIQLFLELLFQIWFQKYYICPLETEFLINKHKNRSRLLFTFPGLVRAWGVSCQIASGYNSKHCSKLLLKKDSIPFLSSYAHSSIATCKVTTPKCDTCFSLVT